MHIMCLASLLSDRVRWRKEAHQLDSAVIIAVSEAVAWHVAACLQGEVPLTARKLSVTLPPVE